MCHLNCALQGAEFANLLNSNKFFTLKCYGVLVACVLGEIGERFASLWRLGCTYLGH
jgi:hypothetical protein